MPGDGGSGGRGCGPRGSSGATAWGRGSEGHTPAPREWVLRVSAASQPLPLLGVNHQQICEHPTSDLAFSETAESPEGSPSTLLPLCAGWGCWGMLVSWSPWENVPGWRSTLPDPGGCLGRSGLRSWRNDFAWEPLERRLTLGLVDQNRVRLESLAGCLVGSGFFP